MLYLVRGWSPDGKQVDMPALSVSAAFDAVAKLERRGVTNIRMVEVRSGREVDLKKLLKDRRP